ncbi:MAG: ribbon-helix-helix protein, CopG family [Acidimicrobiales bacterium]
MAERAYGHTKREEPITDAMIEQFADEAESGYEAGQLRGRRRGPGRPPLGELAKTMESVRLEPALRAAVARRAEAEGTTLSDVIRKALREYLRSA